jgi:hypothetical protein
MQAIDQGPIAQDLTPIAKLAPAKLLRPRRRCRPRPGRRCMSWWRYGRARRCCSSCCRRWRMRRRSRRWGRRWRMRRRSRRWGRRRTATVYAYVVHAQTWCQHRFIARERREHIQICLDSADCRQPIVAGYPVDHRQRGRAFGQYYLELRLRGTRRAVEVVGLPSDEELPVGRSSHRLGEDTAAWAGTHTCIGN